MKSFHFKEKKSYKYFSLPSKINPNPDLPAAFISFFRRIFLMAYAMKIHLKKNAAANGLELKERLQGLTATDVTHSCDQRRLSLYSIYDLKNTVKIHLLNNKT